MRVFFVAVIVLVIAQQSLEVFGCTGGSGNSGDSSSASSSGSSRLCFAQICRGNDYNDIRRWDAHGSGAYGASREGGRSHTGIDIECSASEPVYAPFEAEILGKAWPYGNGKPHDIGICMRGRGSWSDYIIKMFYVTKEVDDYEYVDEGQEIGSMFDMASEFTDGMTNHIHVQLRQGATNCWDGTIVDPTPYVC